MFLHIRYCLTLLLILSVLPSAICSAATITITKPTGGTVTSSPGGINCGDNGNVCTSSNIALGANVTLNATPSANYSFTSWNFSTYTSTVNPISTQMPNTNVTLDVTFTHYPACGTANTGTFTSAPATNLCTYGAAGTINSTTTTWSWSCTNSAGPAATCSANRQYLLTYNAGIGGTVNGVSTTSQQLSYNGNATAVTAVPNTNYVFTSWTDENNTIVSTSTALTITGVQANHTYTANFIAANLIVSKPAHGTVTATNWGINCGVNGNSCWAYIPEKTAFTVQATPESVNYTFNGWTITINGVTTGPFPGTSQIVTMPAYDVVVSTSFIYHATVNGTCDTTTTSSIYTSTPTALCLNGSTPGTVTGATTTWNWYCNGAYGGTNATCSTQRQYLLTYNAGIGGTVNGVSTTSQQLNYNVNAATVTATPNTNYVFTNWTNENGTVISSSPALTVTSIQSNHTYTANFIAANLFVTKPPHGTISTSVGGINCGINGSSCIAYISPGTPFTLLATPESANYTFNGWTITINGITNGGIGTASYDVTMPSGYDVTVAAPFTYHATVNGTCGTAINGSYFDAPANNLCSTGAQSSVTGITTTWNWTCQGSYGGSDMGCNAGWVSLKPPVISSSRGANMVELLLGSSGDSIGYFTLVAGSSATCGTGTQIKAGLDSQGNPAFRFGSLPLSAGTTGSYTVRNLPEFTGFYVCFTAENSYSLASLPTLSSMGTTAAAPMTAPHWRPLGNPGFSGGPAAETALAFDPAGIPYVAFQDEAQGGKITVQRFSNDAWSTVGNPGISAGTAWSTSLAFAPDNTPHVAYVDSANRGKIVVKRFFNGAWSAIGNLTAQADIVSLAFAPDGAPYVAFNDIASGDLLTVMRFTGGAWSTVGSAGFSAASPYSVSLAFAHDGAPHVAYTADAAAYNIKTTVMRFANGVWSTVGNPNFSTGSTNSVTLAFAPDGVPHVAYANTANSDLATVMRFTGGTWSTVGTPDFSAHWAYPVSLAFAPDGTPHLAFTDSINGDRAAVIRLVNGSWVALGDPGVSTSAAHYVALAFNPHGAPHVAYADEALAGRATVMRCNDSTYINSITRLSPETAVTNANTVTYRAIFSAPVNGLRAANFDLNPTVSGAVITSVLPAVGTTQWDITVSTGSGEGVITPRFIHDGRMDVRIDTALPFSGEGYIMDRTPPAIAIGMPSAAISTGNAFQYVITYSDTNLGAVTLTAGDIILNSTGTASGTATVSGSGASRVVTISNLGGSGTLGVTLRAGTAIDTAGNTALPAMSYGIVAVPLPFPPVPAPPGFINVDATQVTLVLQSDSTGIGYFTLLAGSGTACGTGGQVLTGRDSMGGQAFRFGSLPLSANTPGYYTLKNLTEHSAYTLCFTALNGFSLQQVPRAVSLTTASSPVLATPQWHTIGTPGFSGGMAGDTSLAFAPDGTPYVAYTDYALNYRMTVMGLSGGSWTTTGVRGFTSGEAWYPALAFAPDGTPHVVYQDSASNDKATVLQYRNGFWTTVGNAGFTAGQADSATLAFGTDGAPYVAYADGANGYKTSVMRYSNGMWEMVGNAGFSAGFALFPSLAFAPDGTPHVAYRDAANGDRATVMRFSNGSWSPLGNPGFSAGLAGYPALAFAPDGVPYVAYQDGGNGDRATVQKFSNGVWTALGNAGFSDGLSLLPSLAFGPDGFPLVAYLDGANGDRATVMRFRGTSWSTVGTAGFSPGTAGYVSLAVAPDGTPYVAFRDGTSGYGVTVMRYSDLSPSTATMPVSPVSAPGATPNRVATLSLSFNGSGGISTSGDLVCISGEPCKPAAFAIGSSVCLTATPDSYSFFDTWTGDCNGANPCTLVMSADRSVTATFSAADRARIETVGYQSLAQAYGALAPGMQTTIKLLEIPLGEGLINDVARDVVLWGGWNKDFTAETGIPTVLPILTVSRGSVKIRGGIVIR